MHHTHTHRLPSSPVLCFFDFICFDSRKDLSCTWGKFVLNVIWRFQWQVQSLWESYRVCECAGRSGFTGKILLIEIWFNLTKKMRSEEKEVEEICTGNERGLKNFIWLIGPRWISRFGISIAPKIETCDTDRIAQSSRSCSPQSYWCDASSMHWIFLSFHY